MPGPHSTYGMGLGMSTFQCLTWCSPVTRTENYQTGYSLTALPALILWKLPHKIRYFSAHKCQFTGKQGWVFFVCLLVFFKEIWNVGYIWSSHLPVRSLIHPFICSVFMILLCARRSFALGSKVARQPVALSGDQPGLVFLCVWLIILLLQSNF